jgi:hypothetical protein
MPRIMDYVAADIQFERAISIILPSGRFQRDLQMKHENKVHK